MNKLQKTEIPADFPVITICNLNQLQKNNSIDLIQKYSNSPSVPNIYNNVFLMNEIMTYNDTRKRSLIFSLNESLLECFINAILCTHLEFVWSFDPIYGNCYSYNTGFNSFSNSIGYVKITKAGNKNGLRLKLFVGNPNNVPKFIETNGYHVIIHNQTYKISINEGFDVSTGVETNVIINRIYETLKPKPYSE